MDRTRSGDRLRSDRRRPRRRLITTAPSVCPARLAQRDVIGQVSPSARSLCDSTDAGPRLELSNERNGYELAGRVEDFPSGTDVLWYRKRLQPTEPARD